MHTLNCDRPTFNFISLVWLLSFNISSRAYAAFYPHLWLSISFCISASPWTHRVTYLEPKPLWLFHSNCNQLFTCHLHFISDHLKQIFLRPPDHVQLGLIVHILSAYLWKLHALPRIYVKPPPLNFFLPQLCSHQLFLKKSVPLVKPSFECLCMHSRDKGIKVD